MDRFRGNVFVFVPCCIFGSASHERSRTVRIARDKGRKDEFLECMEKRSSSEIKGEVIRRTFRSFLDQHTFPCFDPLEDQPKDFFCEGLVYETMHSASGLAVVTIHFRDFDGPITQLLDRISCDELEVRMPSDSGEDGRLVPFAEVLEKFGLRSVGVTKVCLSSSQQLDEDVATYCFANETYLSADMGARIVDDSYRQQARENIAEYDSSDIYAGARTVVRIDHNPTRECSELPGFSDESKLIFLMEMLLFKEAAIARSNRHVIDTIESGERVTLDVIEELSNQFGSTMPFWHIDSFRYITAQRLADKINQRFGLDERLERYFENQRFLEHRISVRYAQQERSEDAILYVIAILLFLFQGTPFIYKLIMGIQTGVDFGHAEMLAVGGSLGITTTLVVILLALLKRRRTLRELSR